MTELYLGRWEWIAGDAVTDSHWRAPGGNAVGALDLRTLPQCGTPGPTPEGWGLFAYALPTVHANLVRSFGSDLTRNLTGGEKVAIRSAFGRTGGTRVEDRLDGAIRQWFTDPAYYAAAGLTEWKPLIQSRDGFVELKIGGFGTIVHERVDGAHPTFAAHIAVFRADYIRNREVQLLPVKVLRKWTGATLLKLFRRLSDLDADDLMPALYRLDGYEPPTTTISDNFNRANESLDTGPWVETVGAWDVVSNEVAISAASDAVARHTTALSSDDHKASTDITALAATNGAGGPNARFSTDAGAGRDLYNARLEDLASLQLQFAKVVDGTTTSLDTARTVTIGLPDNVEIECDGSAMKSRFNGGLEHNFTDTSLTGQLYCGMRIRRTADRLDNFSAQDLAAATGAASSTVMAMIGVGQ